MIEDESAEWSVLSLRLYVSYSFPLARVRVDNENRVRAMSLKYIIYEYKKKKKNKKMKRRCVLLLLFSTICYTDTHLPRGHIRVSITDRTENNNIMRRRRHPFQQSKPSLRYLYYRYLCTLYYSDRPNCRPHCTTVCIL